MAKASGVKYVDVRGWSDPISQTGLIVVTKRPLMKYSRKKDAEGERLCKCPICGHEDDIQGFDVGGADPNCVFCNQCSTEIKL